MNTESTHHRWLVVDDDATVLELTTEVLRRVPGSEVVACNDSRVALEVLFAEPEAFELVVTDFNMPGLDGLELARAVHERSPQMKIVMVTGSDLEGAEGRSGELQALLPKPCSPSALIAVVRSALAPRWDVSRCEASPSVAPVAARPEPPAKFVSCETSGGPGRKSVCRPVPPELSKSLTINS